jgi:CheY-like chemotaxis protein
MSNENLVVMVIDNNSNLTIGDELERSGYQIITKHNLSQAIEDVADFTSKRRPDLILLEMDQLPAEESWMVDTFRETTQCPDLPVIYLGKAIEPTIQREASPPKLDKFIHQSEMNQLTKLIDELLSKHPKARASNAN